MATLACIGPTTAWAQEDGDLRLRDGAVEHQGRLEVLYQGEWGTVCDDGWERSENGEVACRQLGYANGVRRIHVETNQGAPFGRGTGPILLDDVRCETGNESKLIDCNHRGWGEHNCVHDEDVGVTCWNQAVRVSQDTLSVAEADTAGSLYDVVLADEPTSDVTVTVGGTEDSDVTASPTALTYTTANWDKAQTVTVTAAEDADAVDDTLTLVHSASGGGYDGVSADVVVTVFDDDGANRAPSFDEGTSATRSVAENTTSGSPVGARVSATDDDNDPLTYSLLGADAEHFAIGTTDGQIRTSGALDHEQGVVYRVSVKVEDGAGHDDTIAVTISVSDVAEPPTAPSPPTLRNRTTTSLTVTWNAPSESDRPAADSYDLQYRSAGGSAFTPGPQAVTGTTASITGLARATAYEVQVRARSDEGVGPWSASATLTTAAHLQGDLRLRDGAGVHEGRLEVFGLGDWGTVCDDGWGDPPDYSNGFPNAEVACRQLGFARADALRPASDFAAGTGRILLDDLSCTGSESRLSDCRHRGWGVHNCGHNEDVALTCWTPAVRVSQDTLFVAEADAAGSLYDVVLEVEPTSDVTVTVGGTQGTDVTASPTALTYTTANWDQAQTVTVTAGDDADAVDDTVTLVHSASGGGYDGATVSVVVTVFDDDGANRAPSFDEGTSATRSVAENTTSGSPVGAAVSASDADDDPLTYSLLGADAAHFAVGGADGQIRTSGALDHEQGVIYRVTVKVEDDAGHEDAIAVAISVSDVDEPPSAPSTPTVQSRTTTSLTVTWNAPSDTDRPAAASYDLQYRQDGGGAFTAGPQTVTAITANITGLAPGTAYEVQVRGRSDEGTGPWSASAALHTAYLPGQQGDLVLRDGATNSEGRLEIFLDGRWGTVCDDGWGNPPDYSNGYPNAEVACRQLGFRRALSLDDASDFDAGFGPILLDDVNCQGDESRLVDCRHRASATTPAPGRKMSRSPATPRTRRPCRYRRRHCRSPRGMPKAASTGSSWVRNRPRTSWCP